MVDEKIQSEEIDAGKCDGLNESVAKLSKGKKKKKKKKTKPRQKMPTLSQALAMPLYRNKNVEHGKGVTMMNHPALA